MSCEVKGLHDELTQVKSSLSEAELQIVQLHLLIDVYKAEREEYGLEKIKALEKKLQVVISEHVELCRNLKSLFFF